MSDTASFTRVDPETQRAAIRAAIAARGLSRFALFDTTIEGRIYPNGVEEKSGCVLNEDGRVWSFWTDWDDVRQQVTIKYWDEEPITPRLAHGREYARARRELGLDSPEAAS